MAIIADGTQSLVKLFANHEDGALEKQLISAMEKEHSLMKDMRWCVCNLGAVHKSRLCDGVTRITAPTVRVCESCYVDYHEFEENNRNIDGPTICADTQIEHFADKIVAGLFYGDHDVNPETPDGLCKRLGRCNGKDEHKPSHNVMSAMDIFDSMRKATVKRSTDLTSIYLVGHGNRGFYGLIPQGSANAIQFRTLGMDGKHLVPDDEGNPYPAIEIQLSMDYGCCLHDFHFAARLANISVSALEQGTIPFTTLWEKLAQICKHIQKYRHAATWSFYANPELLALLDLEAQKMNTVVPNRPILNSEGTLLFNGIPIQSEDAIRIGEDFVPESE